jgi:hypothetical protein
MLKMASGEATVETPGYAHVYSATVLDREHELSLALTAIPGDAFADGPPQTVEEVAEILRSLLTIVPRERQSASAA